MKHFYMAIALLCLFTAGCGRKTFTPPETRKGGDGWLDYIEPQAFSASDCNGLDPELGSPEAAVVKFLASRARGDDQYLKSLSPENDWDSRARRKMVSWKDWTVKKFQLRKKKYQDESHINLEVYMEINFNGEVEDGVDNFELVKSGNTWLVLYPPT